MTISADDPRLTAYALGELSDEERAELERELQQSPRARQELAAIKQTAELLAGEFAAEPAPSLTDAQRDKITVAAGKSVPDAALVVGDTKRAKKARSTVASAKSKSKRSRRRTWLSLSVAASWVVVAVSAYWIGAAGSEREIVRSGLSSTSMAVEGHDNERSREQLAAIASNVGHNAPGSEVTMRLESEARVVGNVAIDARESLDPAARPGSVAPTTSPADYVQHQITRNPRASQLASSAQRTWGLNRGGQALNEQVASREHYYNRDRAGKEVSKLYASTAAIDRLETEAAQRKLSVGAERQLGWHESELMPTGGEGRFNTEAYDHIVENPFQDVLQHPLSTFSIDVDTASYANVRRILRSGRLPPPGAVRIEEFVNYFDYEYAPPDGTEPFAVRAEVAACPWAAKHRLVRIGIKGQQLAVNERPASNLVFLLDISGSMNTPAKMPLVKRGLRMLVERLSENDRVAIVVYAGNARLLLDSTSGAYKDKILAAIDRVQPGGSTNGASGIQMAYQIAESHMIADGVNRVILATDGDFNIGITDQSQLVKLIEDQATGGVFLSVLGFGMGNLKDSTMEKLADRGNGNYAYIDTELEARKVLVRQMDGTLVTIAKDVKIQLEFNPLKVAAYRLIGYENRVLAKEDFNDDTKDAGEIGAGHTVTALYEVVPAGEPVEQPDVDALEFQVPTHPSDAARESNDLLILKLRYKQPDGQESKLLRFPVEDSQRAFGATDGDFQFASAVASFGMLLRNSAYRGEATYDAVLEYATTGVGADEHGYRKEFIELVKTARELDKRNTEDSGSQ